MNKEQSITETTEKALHIADVSGSLREQSLEWFFAKSEIEKHDLKDKHFPSTPIQRSIQWGFHFTFGQIEEMYVKER